MIYATLLCAIPVVVLCTFLLAVTIYKKFYMQRTFADKWSKSHDVNCKGELDLIKTELFKSLQHDKDKKTSEGPFVVLEVGVGSGFNFKYYPEGTHLVAVDPNPHFQKYYNENRTNFPKIASKELIVSKGENMDMIESGTVDAVVATLVFCSVGNQGKLLEQINRILRKGGKLYFLEHVREERRAKRMTRFKQNFLTYSGIWSLLFDECVLNNQLLPILQAGNFQKIQYKTVQLPFPDFVNPGISGFAIK